MVAESLSERIESIEQEIRELKLFVMEGRNIEMGGRLQDADFSEEDFGRARDSLFGEA